MDSTLRRDQKYSLDERVEVFGWTENNAGTVTDIRWIYHARTEKHTWGYRIRYDDDKPVLSLLYVPEGYLRKVAKKEETE